MEATWKYEAPRFAMSSYNRYEEVKKCLVSECDSWVLKAEMLLTHVAFVLGFTSPNMLIWKMLKILMNRISTIIGIYIDEFPQVEFYLRMLLSALNQYALDQVWDQVRDSSICMRFNNCDTDFFISLNNIKIKVCDVTEPWNTQRPITTCEKIFNDSPLMVLTLVMLLVMAISHKTLKREIFGGNAGNPPPPGNANPPDQPAGNPNLPDAPPPGNPNPPGPPLAGNPPDQPAGNSNLPDAPPPGNPNPPGPPPPGNPNLPDAPPPENPTPPAPKPGPSNGSNSPRSSNPNPPQPSSNNEEPSQGNEQSIRAMCPKCDKPFNCTVPRPLPFYCAPSCPTTEEGQITLDPKFKNSPNAMKYAKIIKQIKCQYCKEKLRQFLKDLQKQPKPNK